MRASVATAVGLLAGIASFTMAAGWSHPFIALDATAATPGYSIRAPSRW